MKNNRNFLVTGIVSLIVLVVTVLPAAAQTCGGTIIRGAGDGANPGGFLDPNEDDSIVAAGGGFTDCTGDDPLVPVVDEMSEFESLTNGAGCTACNVGWIAVAPVEEDQGDLWAGGGSCGTTDIVLDKPSGAYLYYTLYDEDSTCNNDNEWLILRVRADASVSGSFSFSVLVDTDGGVGAADPDGIQCASKITNGGFEYEILADPANNQTVDVLDINGVVGTNNGLISYDNDIYYNQADACRSICPAGSGSCSSGAVFHTFAVKLSDMGLQCGDSFLLSSATASSGSGTVSSNTSVSDVGGAGDLIACDSLPVDASACDVACCAECTSGAASAFNCFDAGTTEAVCMSGCITSCIADQTTVPVELMGWSID